MEKKNCDKIKIWSKTQNDLVISILQFERAELSNKKNVVQRYV